MSDSFNASCNGEAIGILVKMQAAPSSGPRSRAATRILAEWSQRHCSLIYISPEDVTQDGGRCWGTGWTPDLATDTWRRQTHPLLAIYNRFPASHDPEGLAALASLCDTEGLLLANHPHFQALVWDKWSTYEALLQDELPMPQSSLAVQDWAALLSRWGRLYIKPRRGAFGEGIATLDPGSTAGHFVLTGPTPGSQHTASRNEVDAWLNAQQESVFLQQAISPPFNDVAGFCVRSLLQREGEHWHTLVRVARTSVEDPVANVARGALAQPLEQLLASRWEADQCLHTQTQMDALDQALIKALLGPKRAWPKGSVVEMGVDYLIDHTGKPWLLEINGFPQGRLGQLAKQAPERFEKARTRAHTTPLQTLLDQATSA